MPLVTDNKKHRSKRGLYLLCIPTLLLIVSFYFLTTGTKMKSPGLHTLEAPDLITSVAFSPDGQTLARAGYTAQGNTVSSALTLWDVPTGQLRQTLTSYSEHLQSVVFSPDGRLMVTCGINARMWDGQTGASLGSLPEESALCAFSRDGTMLATATPTGQVRIHDMPGGALLKNLNTGLVQLRSLAFCDNDQVLALAGTKARQSVKAIRSGQETGGSPARGSVSLWSPQGGQLLRELKTQSIEPNRLVSSPDGRVLAVWNEGRDGLLSLWDLEQERFTKQWQVHPNEISSVAWAPDGNVLATAGWVHEEGHAISEIRLWNAGTAKLERTLRGHQHRVAALAFSPKTEMLASGSEDRTAILWNLH